MTAHHHPHAPAPGSARAHQHDRGLRGALRYLRLLPRLWRSEVNDEVVRLIAPAAGERVVDLGAGAGAATVAAARAGATVVAVDPLPLMRSILTLRRAWQPRGRAITVVAGAGEAIPAADGSIDALWTVNTIHHWTEPAAVVRELARVLRPGGRVLLVDEDMGDPTHPEHQAWSGRGAHSHHFDHVDPQSLAQRLVGAGFAQATGEHIRLAGRPSKVVRATR